MTMLFNMLTLITAFGYVVASFVMYHKVLPRMRDIGKPHAIAIWLMATGTGWFGVLLFAETIRYGLLPEMRLFGHLLFQASIWAFISMRLPRGKQGSQK